MPNKDIAVLKSCDQNNPKNFIDVTKNALKKFGLWGSLGRFILMKDSIKKFTESSNSKNERLLRKNLLRTFNKIQKNIPCPHSPFEHIEVANYLFNSKVEGPIIELGVFKGGGTAKLSFMAKITNRTLYVCDSFQGLPSPKNIDELLLQGNKNYPSIQLQPGEFAGGLSEVKVNVRKYGCIEVCKFIPGFFSESLPHLNVKPALVFMDVDLISSAHDCLKNLWPLFRPGGYWFTHEASFQNYIAGVFDSKWWMDNIGTSPPIVIGAGTGLSVLTPSLAYFQKVH